MREFIHHYYHQDNSPGLGGLHNHSDRDVFIGGERGQQLRREKAVTDFSTQIAGRDWLTKLLADVVTKSSTIDDIVEALASRTRVSGVGGGESLSDEEPDGSLLLNQNDLNLAFSRLKSYLTPSEQLRFIEGLGAKRRVPNNWLYQKLITIPSLFEANFVNRLVENSEVGTFYRRALTTAMPPANREGVPTYITAGLESALIEVFESSLLLTRQYLHSITHQPDAVYDEMVASALNELDILGDLIVAFRSFNQHEFAYEILSHHICNLVEVRSLLPIATDDSGVLEIKLSDRVRQMLLYIFSIYGEHNSKFELSESHMSDEVFSCLWQLLSSVTSIEETHRINTTRFAYCLGCMSEEQLELLRPHAYSSESDVFSKPMQNILRLSFLGLEADPELFELLTSELSEGEIRSIPIMYDDANVAGIHMFSEEQLLRLHAKDVFAFSPTDHVNMLEQYFSYFSVYFSNVSPEWIPAVLTLIARWREADLRSSYIYYFGETDSLPSLIEIEGELLKNTFYSIGVDTSNLVHLVLSYIPDVQENPELLLQGLNSISPHLVAWFKARY